MKIIKKIITIILIICLLCLVFLVIYKLTADPITPTSADTVWSVLLERGYIPADMTQEVLEQIPNSGLQTCIVTEKDDIRFEFYSFDNDKGPKLIFRNSFNLIRTERYSASATRVNEHNTNHRRYVLIGYELYSVTMYVGNTAIYAYCNTENSNEIAKIFEDIGYGGLVSEKDINQSPNYIFNIAISIFILLFTQMSRGFLRPLIYASAALTQRDIDKFYDEVKHDERLYQKKSEYLLENSPKPSLTRALITFDKLIFIPNLVAIVTAICTAFISGLEYVFSYMMFFTVIFAFLIAIVSGFIDRIKK